MKLIGFDAEDTLNPLEVKAPDLIDWIQRKDPRAINHWSDLGADEYARAFTAARTAGLDIIDDLYFAFADTIERGGTEVDFAKLVTPTLQAKGWLARPDDDPAQAAKRIATRVDLIYEQNLRAARAAGLWDRVQRTKAALPYIRAVTAQDERVRHPPRSPHSDHRAWQGIILPADHPFWTRWFPPLGFRCRCNIVQMTRSALARFKGGITSPDDLAEREARLGTPIFRAPGAGVVAQLADVAANENDAAKRMPGLPLLDIGATRAAGAAAWNAQTAHAAVDALLDKLFG